MPRSLPGFSVTAILLGLVAPGACAPRVDRPPNALGALSGNLQPESRPQAVASKAVPSAPAPPEGGIAVPAPLALTEVGSDGPLVFEAAAYDGSWLLYCQARTDTDQDGAVAVRLSPSGGLLGDALSRYFAFAGEERKDSELLAAHPNGPWVLLRERGVTTLLDVSTHQELNLEALGAETTPDQSVYGRHRTLAFHATRPLLAYAKKTPEGWSAVLRELTSGGELPVKLPPGELARLEFSQGDVLVAKMLVADTNKNGKLDVPMPLRSAPASCGRHAPIPAFPAWLDGGDEVVSAASEISFAPELSLTPMRLVPGFISGTSAGFLVRDRDHSVWLERAALRTPVAPKACAATIWHVDAGRGSLVFACTRENPILLARLQLFDRGAVTDLGVELRPFGPDRWFSPDRLVPLYPGALTALLDMEKRAIVPLQPDDAIVGGYGENALIWRKKSLFLWDAGTQTVEDLSVEVDALPFVVQNRGVSVVSPYVVDVAARKLLGKVNQRPLAVASSGRVLVARGRQASADGLATGPLEWLLPH